MKMAHLALRCACVLALLMLSACSESSQNEASGAPVDRSDEGGMAGAGSPLPEELPDDSFSNPAGVGGSGGAGGSAGMSSIDSPPAPIGGAGGAAGTGSFAGTGGAGGGLGDGLEGEDSSGGAGSGSGQVQSGTLTAGVWDDNRNFQRFSEYRSDLLQDGTAGAVMPTTDGEHAAARTMFSELGAARALLDISLVIDTTGSMSDELSYLQAELSSISQRIEDDYPNAEQRWSVIVYRDEGDLYVTETFNFTADVAAMRSNLAAQRADGGGDFPEAPDAALHAANALDWREGDDVARLVFWLADAPHHDDKADELKAAVLDAQALGVRIYPVASSGIDELTELTMRSAAQLTGGRYLFLTSDSGVGGEHKEPTIPCYFVTKLDDAIIRMVDIEMSGTYREPTEDEILRTGGDPQDGACRLDGGDEAMVF